MTQLYRLILSAPILFTLLFVSGCISLGISPEPTELNKKPSSIFKKSTNERTKHFAGPEIIKKLSEQKQQDYRLGPGDILDISVWRRPEISKTDIVVAPDGILYVSKVGVINVSGKTIVEITDEITSQLSRNYESPEVTITIKKFNNNKAFVLGRVSNPGVVNFPGKGTLLEALALAGGLPHIGKDTFLTKCAIIRGSDTVIWIDLRDLLDNGNMALNARIFNDDIIFIPEAEDEMVMVLGEVEKPGPILLKRGLNFIDAVMRAGGFTDLANLEKVFILRPDGNKADIREVNLAQMLETGDLSQNFNLKQSDIIYVSPTGMRKYNYVLEQIMPTLQVLSLSTGIMDSLGLSNKVFTLEDTSDGSSSNSE